MSTFTDEAALTVTLQPGGSAMTVLFSPYRCKVIFETGEYGLFGRGSLHFARRVVPFGNNPADAPAITVGDYCDMAGRSVLLLGGEHHHDQIFNTSFNRFMLVNHVAQQAGKVLADSFSHGAVHIGHAVVLSQAVTVRSGVSVGNGAVLGVGAIVTKDIPAFAIAGGNPAKVIKSRFDDKTIEALERIRWWEWTQHALAEHIGQLAELPPADFIAAHDTLETPPATEPEGRYLVFTRIPAGGDTVNFRLDGVEIDGTFTPAASLPQTVQAYLQQMTQPPGSQLQLIHNLFDLCA